MNLDKLSLIRLTEDYDIKPFDCDDADLNGFLFDDAKAALGELIAITYLLEDVEKTIGYFCISNDKISSEDTRGRTIFQEWRLFKFGNTGFDNLHSFPAVKIGRLAIDNEYKGNGIGRWMLDYLKYSFTNNNKTGCRFITVDAYDKSLGFYDKNNFIYLTNKDKGRSTRLMYFDLSEITP